MPRRPLPRAGGIERSPRLPSPGLVVTRRAVLGTVLAGIVGPAPVPAAAKDLPLVAFLSVVLGPEEPIFQAFADELRALGQIDGKTFRFELHVAPDTKSVAALAEIVVRSNPAVLVALEVSAGDALLRFTQTIPIVVVHSASPVKLGWSTSVARPSRNVTGVLHLIDDLAGKRVDILRELVPATRRLGVLYELDLRMHELVLANTTQTATGFGITIVPFALRDRTDLDETLTRIAEAAMDGLIVVPSPTILSHRRKIIEITLSRRLPSVHCFPFEVADGALAAYGTDSTQNFYRAAQYTDRLLGGARIADLPFDSLRQPTLTLNQRTARAIGLDIPSALLARADVVVD